MAKRVNHDERKYEIAEKAMKLFSQVGYDNVTLLMIASSSGVARTVLYRYFRSKREVFDAAIRATTKVLMSDCRKEMSKKGKVADRLSMVCFRVTDALFEKKEFLSAIFDFVLSIVRTGEPMASRILDFTSGIRAAFLELVTDGIMNGEFKSELKPEAAAEALYSLLESCVLRIVLGTDASSAPAKLRFSTMIESFVA